MATSRGPHPARGQLLPSLVRTPQVGGGIAAGEQEGNVAFEMCQAEQKEKQTQGKGSGPNHHPLYSASSFPYQPQSETIGVKIIQFSLGHQSCPWPLSHCGPRPRGEQWCRNMVVHVCCGLQATTPNGLAVGVKGNTRWVRMSLCRGFRQQSPRRGLGLFIEKVSYNISLFPPTFLIN